MTTSTHHFEDVTLLVTHYNRSRSLERLLRTFHKLGCSFDDIVVSDDGSKPEHLEQLAALQQEIPFRLIKTSQNRGLGNNINKGQDAVATAFTLYVQEDFEPTGKFAVSFGNALSLMVKNNDLDIVKFYAYYPYPYLKPYQYDFSEMYIPLPGGNYSKIYQYTDHPHLRRSSFFQKFGRYAEGIKGDKMEYRMCISFIRHKGKGLFYNHFQDIFLQENSTDEPSTMTATRSNWKNSPLLVFIKYVYRQVKYNYDIHFSKF